MSDVSGEPASRFADVAGRSALVDGVGEVVDLASAVGDESLADPATVFERLIVGAVDVNAAFEGAAQLGALTDLDVRCPVPRNVPPAPLVFTGTPAAVGATDGRVLRAGDVVETTSDGIGTLRNHCSAA